MADTLLFSDHKLKNTNTTALYVIVCFRSYVLHLQRENCTMRNSKDNYIQCNVGCPAAMFESFSGVGRRE